MKKEIVLLIILMFFGKIHGQNPCALPEENIFWKRQFEKAQSKVEKIKLIKEKIKSDSIYSVANQNIVIRDGNNNQHYNKNGDECGCKILFLLEYSKKKSVSLNLNLKQKFSKVVEKINVENTDVNFHSFDSKIATSMFGKNGECGFVIITTKNRELKKLLQTTGL